MAPTGFLDPNLKCLTATTVTVMTGDPWTDSAYHPPVEVKVVPRPTATFATTLSSYDLPKAEAKPKQRVPFWRNLPRYRKRRHF